MFNLYSSTTSHSSFGISSPQRSNRSFYKYTHYSRHLTTINRFLCFQFQTCFAIHSTRKLRELLMSSQRLSFNDSMKLACSIEATSLEQLEEHIFPKVIEPCKINVIQQALFLSHRTSNIREVICKVTSVDCIF